MIDVAHQSQNIFRSIDHVRFEPVQWLERDSQISFVSKLAHLVKIGDGTVPLHLPLFGRDHPGFTYSRIHRAGKKLSTPFIAQIQTLDDITETSFMNLWIIIRQIP